MTSELTPWRTLGLALTFSFTPGCSEMHGRSETEFGINLAGAEFGALKDDFSNLNPGREGNDFFFPSLDCLSYFVKQGVTLVRFPISWERLQPRTMGPLNPGYMERIVAFMDLAESKGCQVVIDLHNYGRYREGNTFGIREHVVHSSNDPKHGIGALALSDLWVRISRRVRNHPALYSYGLMNEPHDMGAANWHSTSDQVVAAIRATGDENWIWVSGDGWSKAHTWEKENPATPWVKDALHRVAYEAHVYFDSDSSGRYQRSYSEEHELDPKVSERGRSRLMPFATWCARNKVVGVIGEYGVPWKGTDWLPVLDQFLTELRRQRMTACAWAGGDMWGDYELSLEPRNNRNAAPFELMIRHSRNHVGN